MIVWKDCCITVDLGDWGSEDRNGFSIPVLPGTESCLSAGTDLGESYSHSGGDGDEDC
jgi:hypothetical protein